MQNNQFKETILPDPNHSRFKFKHNEAFANWMKKNFDEKIWTPFSCTVVFRPIDNINTRDRFEQEYKNRVLRKIRRRLERSTKYQRTAIPYEELYYFERYEKSKFRATGKRCPFHIHSLLPIRTSQVHRFWSYENNNLNARIAKDIHSIDIVQDVLIEPIRCGEVLPWLLYISKAKEL
jgi:hypothetical protein